MVIPGVDILKSRHLHKLLWDWSTYETGSTWGRYKTDVNGSTLSVDLAGNGMRFTELVTPVSSTDWDNRQLSQDDGTSDSSGDFLGALDSKSDVSSAVTDGDNGLESSTLSSTGLFLYWLDLEYFVLQCWADEMINDLELL